MGLWGTNSMESSAASTDPTWDHCSKLTSWWIENAKKWIQMCWTCCNFCNHLKWWWKDEKKMHRDPTKNCPSRSLRRGEMCGGSSQFFDFPWMTTHDFLWFPALCPNWNCLVVEPYPSEKWWSSSVGMMTFPTEWKVIQNSMVPVTTNQWLLTINHH